jgi:hypothetical protein
MFSLAARRFSVPECGATNVLLILVPSQENRVPCCDKHRGKWGAKESLGNTIENPK